MKKRVSNYLAIIIFVALNVILNGQSIKINNINFGDTLKFRQTITFKKERQIDYVQYDEIVGDLRKCEYYDSKMRIYKDIIWKDTLVRETEYNYLESNQVIMRYNVTNKKSLPTQFNVHFKYPALARENQIEGIVEVNFEYNSHCVPIEYIILNRLGHGIDEEINKKMQLMINLSKKYNVPLDNCNNSSDSFKINFRLN
ncbi:MAG: hypothetical protein ACI9P5_000889 [Saprospiraceae bacterium]|jgi:hypothetical protein